MTINGDTKIEPDEMFFVNLTNVSGANVIRGQGIGTITNDDTSQPPTGVAAANPTTVRVGDATLLTVTVTPGTKPTSTGITVTGNLSAIGGSTTQTLYDDGTNGDATAGDNIFSYNATVSPSTTTGTKTLTFTISDAQSRSSNASTSVKVAIAIHTIQGSGRRSPFEGQPIVTTGIVTGLRSNGFYIQEKDSQIDADPETSEGVFVFTSSAPPAAKGNLVSVSGTVSEFVPSADPNQLPVTEISFSPTVSLISTGNPLPAPINITSISSSILDQMERYEGMRVHVDSLTAIAPTGGTISEANATSTSSGIFYAVITGTARPFREPGIELLDHAGWPATIPTFDENPERIRVDSGALGGTRLDVTTGQTLANVIGIVDYSFRTYSVLSETTLTTTSPAMTSTPVSQPSLSDFTVAAFNMERFFDTIDDPAISDVALTTTAFNNRLNKASLTIRNILRTPDIIGVEEMENLTTLQAVANKVNNDAVAAGQPNPNYTAYLVEGNDIGGIDVGFLVKSSRVDMVDVTQLGKSTTYTNPNNGLQELLNDRPPLILRAMVHSETNGAFRVTVIANHLRSLSGVDDPVDGPRVRAKRAAQAEFLANLIQARQVADPMERIVSIGDYNALGVNDGYVDSMNSIKGTPTPPSQVAVSGPDLVDPDLTDLVLPTQYSYVFDGNTQTLDHILINRNIFGHVEIAHNDADFPEIYRNDANRPERITDHDIPVAYFSVPAPRLTLEAPATGMYGSPFNVTVTAFDELNNVVAGWRGTVTFSSTLTASLPAPYTFTATDAGSHTFTITPLAAGANTITAAETNHASSTVQIAPAPLRITADDKLAIFGSALPPFTASYDGLVAGDTPASLPTPAFSSPASVGTTIGQYPIHVSGVSSPNYDIKFFDGTLTIIAASTKTAVPAVSGQYSDSATISASVSPAFLAGQQLTGTVAFTLNGESIGSVPIDVSGAASVIVSLNRAPGSYAVAASFTSTNSNFDSSAGNNTLTVSPEDARATYSGPLLVSTPSVDISATTITLRATIQDISVTPDAGGDTKPGDIANANVTIVDRDSGATIASNLSLSFLDTDHTSGRITFDWPVNIGSLDAQTFHIGFIVGNYYARNNSNDDALITVSKPALEFISGGGYLNLMSSGGPLAGNGSKANFGFAFKYNKSGTNLKGHINLMIRSGSHTWEVKSNNPTSLAGMPSTGRVTVVAKATVRELGGGVFEPNATVELSMSDNGEPGENDTLAITAWSKSGALLFSSNWNGAKTEEQLLGGGNLQVH